MPQPILKNKREKKHHLEAWIAYRDMGLGRSYRQTAKLVGRNVSTIANWSKTFGWQKRLIKWGKMVVKTQKEQGDLITKNPVTARLKIALGQMEAMIRSAFRYDEHGIMEPNFTIDSAESFAKVMAEYRKLTESLERFSGLLPPQEDNKRKLNIDELNIYLSGLSQEEKINLLQGKNIDGTKLGGDQQSSRGVEEADFTEVSESGDENGS